MIDVDDVICEGGGHWDFRFCGFGYFFSSVFRFLYLKKFGFLVLVFIAVCGYFVFREKY